MKKQWQTSIDRAIKGENELFPLNQTWLAIHQEYNIGVIQAGKLRLDGRDKQELRVMLKKITGIDLQQINIGEFADMEREQVLNFAVDEKLAGHSVKRNRLAIKSLPERELKLNSQAFRLPSHSHADIALESITSVEHGSLWIVENYRCFDRLEMLQFSGSAGRTEPLIVFRGDNFYHAGTVLSLINKLQLPVWVMGDLDPKGLSIAQSYPNFSGLIAPEIGVVKTYFSDKRKANHKLYDQQLAGCQRALSDSGYPIIEVFWRLIKNHQAGIVQEQWLTNPTVLELHPTGNVETSNNVIPKTL